MTTRTKYIIAFIAVFIFGVIVGSSGDQERIVEKRVEVPVEKIVEVGSYQEELHELKNLDDQIIQTAQSAITACGEGFIAISEGDLRGLNKTTTTITELTPKMERLMIQRAIFVEANEL